MSGSGEDAIILRSITVSEVMAGDGEMWLQIGTEGDPPTWTQMGMLAGAMEALRIDIARVWSRGDTDDEDTSDD